MVPIGVAGPRGGGQAARPCAETCSFRAQKKEHAWATAFKSKSVLIFNGLVRVFSGLWFGIGVAGTRDIDDLKYNYFPAQGRIHS